MPEPPRTFKIHACVGRGGYGEVYRATMYASREHDVAIKVLHSTLDNMSQPVQRLRDERRMLAAVRHPSILEVHDLVVLEGRIGLVTEWVQGQDLNKCAKGEEPLSDRAAVEVVERIADALHTAHHAPVPGVGALGLIHRDVKPSNIRIGRDGQVKLLDFGIARTENLEREAKTNADSVFGSFPYMAPERFLSASSGPRGDVFSLGVTLYEVLCGERMWRVPLSEIYKLVMNESRYNVALEDRLKAIQHLPPALVQLVRGMAQWDPEDRPSAKDVRDTCADLADLLEGPALDEWCHQRVWPALQFLPGLFSGRVVVEDEIDPQEADNVGNDLEWDANDQEPTVHIQKYTEPAPIDLMEDATTAAPAPSPRRAPGPSPSPRLPARSATSHPAALPPPPPIQALRVGTALVMMVVVLTGVFVSTFSVMLYLLQRFGG